MAGKFERRKFQDCSLSDPFFDSLKNDYPEFSIWFAKKAAGQEEAFVFEDNIGLCAFIYLKENESEEIKLTNKVLPSKNRIKIGTLKLDDRHQGQRLGEGAIGIVLWKWQESDAEEIYLTVYNIHEDLITLIEKYGFICAGELLKEIDDIDKKELVYIKSKKNIDYSDPHKSFPFINPNFKSAGMLPIYDYFHDRLLPYSELKGTEQEFLAESAGNGITKVFIGSPFDISGLHKYDPIFLYRICTEKNKKATYTSCITSYGTITKIIVVKNNGVAQMTLDDFIKLCGNKTVFSNEELTEAYEKKNLVIFEFVYNGFLGEGNNIIHKTLKDLGLFKTYPYGIRYSKEEFCKIMKLGEKNVQNIIID